MESILRYKNLLDHFWFSDNDEITGDIRLLFDGELNPLRIKQFLEKWAARNVKRILDKGSDLTINLIKELEDWYLSTTQDSPYSLHEKTLTIDGSQRTVKIPQHYIELIDAGVFTHFSGEEEEPYFLDCYTAKCDGVTILPFEFKLIG